MSSPEPLDPEAAAVLSKVRRLMATALLITGVAVALVFAVVGWRLMRLDAEGGRPFDAALALPKGARVVANAVAGERIVLTVEAEGHTELLTLDAKTLQLRGRLRLTPEQ